MPADLPAAGPERPRHPVSAAALNVARGAVIGAVEIVPGVSGGTLALVVGVYDTLIDSAGSLVRAAVQGVRSLASRRHRDDARALAREHSSRVRWGVLIPLGLGMLAAIIVVSATLAPLIEEHPVETRALFAGLIVASIAVPARMVTRWRAGEVALAVAGAAAAFWLTGLTGTPQDDPAPWMIALSASIAVCALVLPGVSGSFMLLVLGMYGATLAAVNDRDLAYLATFVLGAILGLALFVTGLQWLLAHRRNLTLAAMTGLMVGSLRALWPWQSEDGTLEPPGEHRGAVILLFAMGIAAVTALMALERAARARVVQPEASAPA
ncbi:DUF368 domain-containing protein [Demequina sp. NBRC 110053]|uniref:DUF368 domain-containing protein n=1 Tax=Demequina sp. NBRC 110053 TaxID=1570342 RepID=UPI0009FBD407|nr:DUF368 domain-containing protein [Demequina sp. NBRC 110053]